MRPIDRKSVLRCTSVLAGAGLAIAISAQQFGCSTGPASSSGEPSAPGVATPDATGSLGVKLTIGGNEILNTISWVITGPNGASTVVQQGSADVSRSNTIAFVAGNIPPGSNYTIAITGTTTDGLSTCAGSATFSIAARATTNVSALLQCRAPVSEAGAARVAAQTYTCASVSTLAATPAETTIGNSVALSATANSANAAGLTYAWSASSGTFSAPTSATTNFTCTAAGSVTVALTVADGTVPDGGACDATVSTMTVSVQCDAATGAPTCSLGAGGAIKHVIYVQFDNTHLSQDNPNVPSDLQQMPHLLNFIRGNGTMMANDHTVLISHTAGGMLSTLTGLYPDRNGQTVSNSYVRTSAAGTFTFPSSFGYWTDQAYSNTTIPNMVDPNGNNLPAPWVAYTRAGCNFGAVGTSNVVIENNNPYTNGDVAKVFGLGSPQFAETQTAWNAPYPTAASTISATDFEGLAVHCASGSALCAAGEQDLLPSEPSGYTGFYGLFGAQQIDPVLTGHDAGTALTDLLGNPITDPYGQPGFPGFDGMSAAVSLSYVAAMQEKGIPVTYAYISDAHDNHGVDGNSHTPYGPGQAGYVAQLQAYDQAFANFFTRLAADGINQSNTLFIFTVDEGDHFVGASPTPANCDGVTTPCNYAQAGEINLNVDTLMNTEFPSVGNLFLGSGHPDSFTVHGDDAPTFYLSRVTASDAGVTGPLGQTDPDTRTFERAVAQATAVNPYTSNTDHLLYKMADQTGMAAIHMMTTGDPARNPTFVYFADDNYYITDYPASTCADCVGTGYAWNHGDDQSVIGQTWVGFVGPGVKNQPDQTTFTDHTDVRPTILSILGLQDPYQTDGRVITEALQSTAYSSAIASNVSTAQNLGALYKQINAPFGPFSDCVLTVSTAALQASDSTYASLEAQIASMTSTRNTLATAISNALSAAEFGSTPVDPTMASNWTTQGNNLLAQCTALASTLPVADAGAGDAGANDATTTGDAGSADATTGDAGSDATASDAASGSSDAQSSDVGADAAATPVVAVYRVGDGTTALSSAANPVFIDEFTATGALVTSIAMPTSAADAGSSYALVSSGSATSEGEITRSVDGHYVLLTGYNAPVGTASIASTASASVARVIGRVDVNGNVNTSTALNAFTANNPRSVASPDGTNLWVGGANSGVLYTTLGSSSFVSLNTQATNLRQLEIFGGQLYASTGSTYTPAVRIGTLGGLPQTSDGGALTIANLPGFASTGGSPYGFFFATLNGGTGPDTLYVADDGAGITKYSLVGGSWTATGTVGSSTDAYRSVTGIVTGTSVTLFATGGGTKLATLVDGSGFDGTLTATATTLATPATNQVFRGVALAPQ